MNLKVRDSAAFQAAGMKVGMKLMTEAPKFTDIQPVVANLTVRAAG